MDARLFRPEPMRLQLPDRPTRERTLNRANGRIKVA
jgi:hypothetical protein